MECTADVHHHVAHPRLFHIRMVSLSLRPRLTQLLTCSMRTRRRALSRLSACCAGVNASPRGFFVGGMLSTPASVNA